MDAREIRSRPKLGGNRRTGRCQRWRSWPPPTRKDGWIEGFDWGKFLKRETQLNGPRAPRQVARRGRARDAILLTVGPCAGGAIISDGRLLKGSFGRAGHLVHVSVTETTERSIFGTPGSLEAAMGDYTVGIRSRGRFSSTRQLVEAHSAGDAEATEIWQKSLKVRPGR